MAAIAGQRVTRSSGLFYEGKKAAPVKQENVSKAAQKAIPEAAQKAIPEAAQKVIPKVAQKVIPKVAQKVIPKVANAEVPIQRTLNGQALVDQEPPQEPPKVLRSLLEAGRFAVAAATRVKDNTSTNAKHDLVINFPKAKTSQSSSMRTIFSVAALIGAVVLVGAYFYSSQSSAHSMQLEALKNNYKNDLNNAQASLKRCEDVTKALEGKCNEAVDSLKKDCSNNLSLQAASLNGACSGKLEQAALESDNKLNIVQDSLRKCNDDQKNSENMQKQVIDSLKKDCSNNLSLQAVSLNETWLGQLEQAKLAFANKLNGVQDSLKKCNGDQKVLEDKCNEAVDSLREECSKNLSLQAASLNGECLEKRKQDIQLADADCKGAAVKLAKFVNSTVIKGPLEGQNLSETDFVVQWGYAFNRTRAARIFKEQNKTIG